MAVLGMQKVNWRESGPKKIIECVGQSIVDAEAGSHFKYEIGFMSGSKF